MLWNSFGNCKSKNCISSHPSRLSACVCLQFKQSVCKIVCDCITVLFYCPSQDRHLRRPSSNCCICHSNLFPLLCQVCGQQALLQGHPTMWKLCTQGKSEGRLWHKSSCNYVVNSDGTIKLCFYVCCNRVGGPISDKSPPTGLLAAFSVLFLSLHVEVIERWECWLPNDGLVHRTLYQLSMLTNHLVHKRLLVENQKTVIPAKYCPGHYSSKWIISGH